jgi:ABC-2 type transport system ATP-binding protein
MPVQFDHVVKSYNGFRAVDDVSFEVREGEIFGLLGPNGAGKTTLMRILMDILRPDSGRALIGAKPSWDSDKDRIGYLPEERGLYRKQRVADVLVYFGMLKGMDAARARKAALAALTRLDLADWARRKIEELSKGMQQKVQILSTLLHDPDLVVMDEPFSGLDPVNTRMVREILEQLKARGKIVILSTHQMEMVEALCDRIAMIDRGRLVLYGTVREVRRAHSEDAILVAGAGDWASFRTVREAKADGEKTRLVLAQGASARDFLAEAASRNIVPAAYEAASTPLEEIFVNVVRKGAA